MKCSRFLPVAIFTFAFGLAISPIRFYTESIACGFNSSRTSYRSSYLIQTSLSHIAYDSEADASEAFRQQLDEALDVIEVKPRINKQGVLIEQHAVGLFRHRRNDEYYFAAFWREGKILCRISSRSYIHVVEFEKQKF